MYTSLTLAEFLKNESDFQSCMIYGSESSFFGLKMGGVEKMHLMMVSTLAKVDMAKNYYLQICITKLPSNS